MKFGRERPSGPERGRENRDQRRIERDAPKRDTRFDGGDHGANFRETDTKIAKGSNKREYTLEAGDKATEGSQTIKYDVKGPSATKTEFKGEFKVNVKKK